MAEIVGRMISLITFVYLARVLSPEGFGIIGFATAFVSYFVLFVNFGFDAAAIRNVSN